MNCLEHEIFNPSNNLCELYIQTISDEYLSNIIRNDRENIKLYTPKDRQSLVGLLSNLESEEKFKLLHNSFSRHLQKVPQNIENFRNYLRKIDDNNLLEYYDKMQKEFNDTTCKNSSELRNSLDVISVREHMLYELNELITTKRHLAFHEKEDYLWINNDFSHDPDIWGNIVKGLALGESRESYVEFSRNLGSEFYNWAVQNPDARHNFGMRFILDNNKNLYLSPLKKQDDCEFQTKSRSRIYF